jgi:hypothetical protein
MGQYAEYLRALLAPLGVYDLSQSAISGGEVEALGDGMDAVSTALALAEREIALTTAEDAGLTRREALFARKIAAPTLDLRRQAIQALSNVGGDSLTLQAVNETLSGCGIRAQAEETETFGCVRVRFPDVVGVPEEFDRIREIALDILPCHLETEFFFRYLTWAECEAQQLTWAMVEAQNDTWEEFQMAVPEE